MSVRSASNDSTSDNQRTHVVSSLPAAGRRPLMSQYDREIQSALRRINKDRATIQDARKRYSTLDEILNSNYTTGLPSEASATDLDADRRSSGAITPDDSIQHVNSERSSHTDNAVPISQEVNVPADSNPNQSHSHARAEPEGVEYCDELNHMPTGASEDGEPNILAISQEPPVENIDSGEGEDVSSCDEPVTESSESDVHEISPAPQATPSSRPSDEEHEDSLHDENDTENEEQGQESNLDTTNESGEVGSPGNGVDDAIETGSVSSEDDSPPLQRLDKGKGRAISPSQEDVPQNPHPLSGFGRFLLDPRGQQSSSRAQFPATELKKEELLDVPPKVPTETHFAAASRLAPDECLLLINNFLQQNQARLDAFRAPRDLYKESNDIGGGHRALDTLISPMWDNQRELDFLTDAVLWIDALLSPFQANILSEDFHVLRPQLQDAAARSQAIKSPFRASTDAPLTDEEAAVFKELADHIADIQTSNSQRQYLLGHTIIDVAIFEDLLQSAEVIKYRRDIGREYGQKDNLIDGLRRIYSTIICSVPVGLSETTHIEQSKQPDKLQYRWGPFSPYRLPDRPELFDHVSMTVGNRSAIEQNPLSEGYWRSVREEMAQATAAQKHDEVGQAKLRKNPHSSS
ncbi:hypothetical protein OPT61_g8814 [Boeremia exigua]|uniref:Uncharacterized protein n=1 Tax=Boeremia exigua TaxID=749465 RepID=A0ACC2HXA5_9PLEO|nr:hypothetical protein OPT61_g8814 [Boeremia exigua]